MQKDAFDLSHIEEEIKNNPAKLHYKYPVLDIERAVQNSFPDGRARTTISSLIDELGPLKSVPKRVLIRELRAAGLPANKRAIRNMRFLGIRGGIAFMRMQCAGAVGNFLGNHRFSHRGPNFLV